MSIPLVWSNWLLPRLALGLRGRTAANAGFAAGYAVSFGSRPNWASTRGVGYGLAAASVVGAGYGAALAIKPIRNRLRDFADRGHEVPLTEWVAVHIPIGTVYSEELIFRATLNPLLDNVFGPPVSSVLGATIFGLWHIHPANTAGDNIPATIAATAAAGLLFDLLHRRADSTTAPALPHFALNAGGAITPWLAARSADASPPKRGRR